MMNHTLIKRVGVVEQRAQSLSESGYNCHETRMATVLKGAQPVIHITRSPGNQKWMPQPPGYLEKRAIDKMSLVVFSDRECAASWSTRILTFKHQRRKIRRADAKSEEKKMLIIKGTVW